MQHAHEILFKFLSPGEAQMHFELLEELTHSILQLKRSECVEHLIVRERNLEVR